MSKKFKFVSSFKHKKTIIIHYLTNKKLLDMQKKNSANGFSERLISLMQQKELTLAQVANGVGKSSPSVHRWTRGGEIDYDNLRALADYLEVNWIWLRYGDNAIKSIEDSQQAQNPMGDIRRKYLTEIMESEARMKTALEMARIVTWEWNILTGALILSENATQVFGVNEEKIRTALLPFEGMQLEDLLLKFNENVPHNWSFKLEQPENDSEKWFSSRGTLVKDSANRPTRIFGISADITDRKNAEQALEYSELMMRNMIEIIPVGLCGADKNGRIHLLNPEVQRIWGGAKFVGLENYGEYKGWKEGSEIELGAEGWSLARAVKYGEATEKEIVNIEAFDGEKRTIVMYAKPLMDANNNIIGAIEVNQDITEIKKIENELKNAHLDWYTIFNQEAFGVIKITDDLKIVSLNKKATDLFKKSLVANTKLDSIFDETTIRYIKDISLEHSSDAPIRAYKIKARILGNENNNNWTDAELLLFFNTIKLDSSQIIVLIN